MWILCGSNGELPHQLLQDIKASLFSMSEEESKKVPSRDGMLRLSEEEKREGRYVNGVVLMTMEGKISCMNKEGRGM